MKNNISRHFISFYSHYSVDNKRDFLSDDESYTLYFDTKSKGVYKTKTKSRNNQKFILFNNQKFILLFIIMYPMMDYFPNELLPYDNKMLFICMVFILISLSLSFGYFLNTRLSKDVRRISLSKEKWKYYLDKGNQLYVKQITWMSIILLFGIICFVFTYIYQTKWWMFGGIATFVIAGTSITLFSRTRYLLYRNRIDVKLNKNEKEQTIYSQSNT